MLFRSSMASAHYTASQGDIMAAKAVLNHANVATTDIYVDGEAVRRLERDTIARLQSLMITWVTGETPAHDSQHQGPDTSARVTALFGHDCLRPVDGGQAQPGRVCPKLGRSEEHTSELQSLMRISYADFCLKQKNTHQTQ